MDTPQGRVIVLRDPFGFTPAILQVSQQAFYIISLLNGENDLPDVQAAFMRQFGDMLHSDRIEELITQLDSCHFLDNERFAELKKKTIDGFLESPTRPAHHAGQAYPAGGSELTREIERMFRNGQEEPHIDRDAGANTVRGLMVPHIDFERGGAAYALGYAELAENSRAETYVVMGTAHCEMSKPFCLTLKDFETPLGLLANDREFGEELLARCPWLTDDEFAHRSEHSIEFQAVFLQHLFGERRQGRIVPVLCGAFHRDGGKSNPLENGDVKDFIEALRESVSKRGDSVCIIAGADLSHVGQRFGDRVTMNRQFLDYLRERDTKTLECVQKVAADEFYHDVTEDGDKRKICGLPNIYTMLCVLGGGSGRLIKYVQGVDKATESVVTFASLVIE